MSVIFRSVDERDRREIEDWIAADPGHTGQVQPDFFLNGNGVASVYGVGDEEATVMYVRQERDGIDTRMHIQFGPDKKRIIRVFSEAFPQVAADAKRRGFRSIVFDSCSPALVRWMADFGFKADCRKAL